MRAIVATAYGSSDVLEIRVLDKPTPRSNEILIRIHATTVTVGDWRMRSLDVPTGFGSRPGWRWEYSDRGSPFSAPNSPGRSKPWAAT
jgi:NADPH:quinone reductase-like Zn-dependent oxidoreductase